MKRPSGSRRVRKSCPLTAPKPSAKNAVDSRVAKVGLPNSTPGVAGFSPSQWVLGYQPALAGDLLSDATQSSLFGGNQTLDMLAKRHAARKALNDADADRRLRRALTLKYKGTNAEYALGQQVWFWRDAQQPDLVKIRWLGPT